MSALVTWELMPSLTFKISRFLTKKIFLSFIQNWVNINLDVSNRMLIFTRLYTRIFFSVTLSNAEHAQKCAGD